MYQASWDQTYVDYLSAWFERHQTEAAVKNVNHVAPMLTLVSLLEQQENAQWRALLNDMHSYQELSATAAIAYAFLKGFRLGILDSRFADAGVNAIAALLARIDQQGQLAEVSSGTLVFMTLPEYTDVPIRQRSYGQSLAMLALAEMLRHPNFLGTKPV
ncbi:MAG: glycoside hydrolase family 88 protein [Symbiopectobacterium sp.]|uniref:glycoside hydrolase family 88 protein n=1 Tax=Symbiopectobacterium sp. TaxID=2952789 RepID=UPI003F2F6DE4